jgi:hypothetical protein
MPMHWRGVWSGCATRIFGKCSDAPAAHGWWLTETGKPSRHRSSTRCNGAVIAARGKRVDGMAARLTYQQRLLRKLPRVVKFSRQWLRVLANGRPGARFVFIVGAQRSGTRLPVQILAQAPEIATYSEGAAPFFDDVFLRPLDRLEELALKSPAAIIALKPICETHRIHDLLDRFPSSKAVWIFRNYQATALSASRKWTAGRAALGLIARRQNAKDDWRVGGLSEEKLQLVRRLYRDDMSEYEAHAVMWYLRNGLYFDLGAHERKEILLVRYEALIGDPQEQFARLFRFVGAPVPEGALATIRTSNRPPREAPPISPEISMLCEELQDRLIAHHNATSGTSRAMMNETAET